MNKLNRITYILLSIFLMISLTACSNNNDHDKNEKSVNYSVVGIWCANVEIRRDNPYNYGGDKYYFEFFIEFNTDGSMRNRSTTRYNGILMSDTDWINSNSTYTVENNVIKISTGKNFVIINDEFNDYWTEQNVTLKYKKQIN